MRFLPAIALSAAVALLAGCSTPSPEPASSSPASSPPISSPSASPTEASETFSPGAPAGQCLTANLVISFEGPFGSAGHLNYRIAFTNNGPTCVLQGFPGVAVVRDGTQLGQEAEDAVGFTPAAISLDAGGVAVSHLSSVNIDPAGGPLGNGCSVDHGDGYRITAPHSMTPFTVAAPNVAACTNGITWMTIDPVQEP